MGVAQESTADGLTADFVGRPDRRACASAKLLRRLPTSRLHLFGTGLAPSVPISFGDPTLIQPYVFNESTCFCSRRRNLTNSLGKLTGSCVHFRAANGVQVPERKTKWLERPCS